jgi:DNA-binding IclR family transcriptional regulator
LEFAAIANALGVEVTVVEAMPRLMGRAVCQDVSDFYARAHRADGIRVALGVGVVRIDGTPAGDVDAVYTSDGRRLAADLVVVGIGVVPDSRLAASCGLAVDNGVVVDPHLLTADPAISAIGDCANYPSQFTGAPIRLESVQNAADQARCVTARIAGNPAPYDSLPWFWSEQGRLRLQLVGLTTGHDRTVVRGDPSSQKFSVFCFRGDRLLGVESVNCPADHMAARRLLAGAPDLLAELTPAQVADPGFDLKAYAKDRQPSPGLRHEIRELRAEIRPFMDRLHEELDETVDLAVLDGRQVRFIDQVPAPNRLRATSAIGSAFPLHCTANGKALLAALSNAEAAQLLPDVLEALTPRTIDTAEELVRELDVIRLRGVAVDHEEHTVGICAVGAVVKDGHGRAAAISVPVPTQRFVGNEQRFATALADTCLQCSRSLDGSSHRQPAAR